MHTKDSDLVKGEAVNPLWILGSFALAGLVIWGAITAFGSSKPSTSITASSTPPLSVLYTNATANVRSCPSSDCKVVGTYPPDTSIPAPSGTTDASQLPEWVLFSYTADDGSTATGYINKSVLSTGQDTNTSVTSQTPAVEQVSAQTASNPIAATQQPAQSSASGVDPVTALSPRLAYITCNWYNRYGSILFSKTSNGLLGPESSNGTYFISTVQGGVTDTAYAGYPIAPSTCSISFPAGASLYAGGLSTFTAGSYVAGGTGSSPVNIANPNVDFAQVAITVPNNYLASYAKTSNYCLTRPSVNDAVEVIGWPTGGAGKTLTGSITSTSGSYDTTNIAVPAGMQGSTAVLTSSGCVVGQINASGQIADFSQLKYIFGW